MISFMSRMHTTMNRYNTHFFGNSFQKIENKIKSGKEP